MLCAFARFLYRVAKAVLNLQDGRADVMADHLGERVTNSIVGLANDEIV